MRGVEASVGGQGDTEMAVFTRTTELVYLFILQMTKQFQRLEVTCPGPPASESLTRSRAPTARLSGPVVFTVGTTAFCWGGAVW